MQQGHARAILLSLTIFAAALAGCASKPAPADDEDGFGADVQATDTTGVIRGIVIDSSIVPIPNADVRIPGGAATITDADGQFWFEDLAPGTYFVEVAKPGFAAAQTSTNVIAGEDRPPILKVMLAHDLATRPYAQQYQFEGFLQCSARAGAPDVGSVGGNACSLLDITGQPLDDPLIRYTLDRRPDWIQTEMVWEGTQPLGDDLELLHSWECTTNDGFFCDHSAVGASPLTLISNATIIAEAGYDETQPLIVRVFSAAAAGSGDTVGVTFDQRFTHFTTVFYGFTPEPGWHFVEDGGPTLPA